MSRFRNLCGGVKNSGKRQHLRYMGKGTARQGGPLRLSKKPRRVFSPQRKNKFNRFLRRHVRRRKHISRSEVSNCTPLAYNRGMERSAIPFVEEGLTFFDKLKGPPDRAVPFPALGRAGLLPQRPQPFPPPCSGETKKAPLCFTAGSSGFSSAASI